MKIHKSFLFLSSLACAMFVCGAVLAGGEEVEGVGDASVPAAHSDAIDFFQAKADETIDVKYVAKDSLNARLILKNKTDKPVTLRLPEAFAGVPVLAQIGGGLGGGGLGGGGLSGGGSQTTGGGFGGGGFGGGGFGGGGGLFNVAPEKTHRIPVKTVCLDHGKPDPNPHADYDIVPLEEQVDRPAVVELVKAFGRGEVHQGAAQAAVWHLNNDLSWEQLASKMRGPKNPRFGQRSLYFSPYELRAAMVVAQEAVRRAKQTLNDEGDDPYKLDSLSRR